MTLLFGSALMAIVTGLFVALSLASWVVESEPDGVEGCG